MLRRMTLQRGCPVDHWEGSLEPRDFCLYDGKNSVSGRRYRVSLAYGAFSGAARSPGEVEAKTIGKIEQNGWTPGLVPRTD